MRITYRRWVRLFYVRESLVKSVLSPPRRQLYGEDNLSAADDDHILHLGLGWAARVREYAPTCLQRCGGHLIHVRPLSQVDAQLGEGVVPSGKGVQQGAPFPHMPRALELTLNTSVCRPRYRFLSAPSLIPLRRSRAMNRRKLRNRPNVSPRRCTHLSSFARHPHRSTCKRSSKSCSQRRLTSNVSSPRSKGWVSRYCSMSTFECPERIDELIISAPCIRADCTPTQCLSVRRHDATSYLGYMGPPGVFLPTSHPLYISPFVGPALFVVVSIHCCCCISRSASSTCRFIHPTRCNPPFSPYFRSYLTF